MSALREPLYRVVLTGELRAGVTEDAVLPELAELLRRSPERLRGMLAAGNQAIDRLYSSHDALQLQQRLEALGIGSRVEASREGGDAPSVIARAFADRTGGAPADAGRMRCPNCGHEQSVGEACERCGIDFENYHRMRRSGAAPPLPESTPPVVPPTRPEAPKSPGWDDFDETAEPGEEDYLALFVGPDAPRYLAAFRRYRQGEEIRFALGWNWRAVFSPFLWALHRKLWWLAGVLAVIEVLIPAWLLVLGAWPGTPFALTAIGLGLLVGNRIVWPALVDYLYLRHARGAIARLGRLSATGLHETQILTHGGVSLPGVLGGLAFGFVSLMLMFNVADGLGIGRPAADRGAAYRLGLPQEPVRTPRREPTATMPRAATGGGRGIPPAAPLPTESKWVATRSRLRVLGARIDAWAFGGAAAPLAPADLTLARLQAEAGIKDEDWRDAWQTRIQFIPGKDGYRLVSAGPDQLFGTADDIQFRKVVPR